MPTMGQRFAGRSRQVVRFALEALVGEEEWLRRARCLDLLEIAEAGNREAAKRECGFVAERCPTAATPRTSCRP